MNSCPSAKFSVFLILLVYSNANAAVINFDSLSGENMDPYSGHTEESFSVSVLSGDWREAHVWGFPSPGLFGITEFTPSTASIEVVENTTGWFQFSNVRLALSGDTSGTYQISGFLDSSMVLSFSGSLSEHGRFEMLESPDPSQVLDTLIIEITPNNSYAYNLDRIEVIPIPEPSPALLPMVSSFLLLGMRNRSR